jgi:ATP-dependent Lon protease
VTKIRRKYDTVSGDDFEKVRRQLLQKTVALYNKLEKDFEDLSKKSRQSNVRDMLMQFANEARSDRINVTSLIDGNIGADMDMAESSYGMFDHIDSSKIELFNEDERAIMEAIKISKDLKDMFTIISREYSDNNIRNTFERLAKHEIHRKNELEELYEELIVNGEW